MITHILIMTPLNQLVKRANDNIAAGKPAPEKLSPRTRNLLLILRDVGNKLAGRK